ncbi:hypothetical protein [Streptomyces sp. NBC_01210]|uniref:hypothetical protein n=1 Tax=Streptomyces sp. NBC_01210 TaxID=2903774 RepID=UPI003FA3C56A
MWRTRHDQAGFLGADMAARGGPAAKAAAELALQGSDADVQLFLTKEKAVAERSLGGGDLVRFNPPRSFGPCRKQTQ